MLSTTASRKALTAGLLRPRQPLGLSLGGLARAPHPALLLLTSLSSSSISSQFLSVGRRTYVSAPRPGDGPLMERRADRELPDVIKGRFRWSRTLPFFLLIIAGCSVAIFNYQKASSPVVASTLYALRTSPKARAYLGDEVYFQQRIPWIAGEMNQMRGRIDINFMVKGTRNSGRMRFTSRRPTARGVFETIEWSLETSDGRKLDLLEDVTNDPFRGIQILPEEYVDALVEDFGAVPPPGGVHGEHGSAVISGNALEPVKETRGFRQPTKR